MLDEFIKDTLHAEIVGIVSSTLTVSNMHVYLKKFLGYNPYYKCISQNFATIFYLTLLGEPIEAQRRNKTLEMAR